MYLNAFLILIQTVKSKNIRRKLFNIDLFKRESLNFLSIVFARYEISQSSFRDLLFTVSNIDKRSWNSLKYKFARKLLSENETFVMVFGGTSVTAGHDNYFNQSYPMIVKKRLVPIMNTIGIRLVVENIAQGAFMLY